MSWFCESGCMEKRPGDAVFGFDDRDWDYLRHKQGVPANWVGGVHVVCCSTCSNLFETWLRAQPLWTEYLGLKAKESRLGAELETGKRPPEEVERDLVEHTSVVMEGWVKRAAPLVREWWAARTAEITAENSKTREAMRALRDEKKAAAKKPQPTDGE